jgi:hypothetical protein
MRTVGIIALFGLALCAIGEGAMIVRLSHRVEDLGHQLETVRSTPEEGTTVQGLTVSGSPFRPALPAIAAARPPEFKAAQEPGSRGSPLQELATPEGRQLLRSALDVINEERRQERLTAGAARREEREQRLHDRIVKTVPLVGDESVRLAAMFSELKTGRQQILDEMHGGGKTAEQANDAIDALRDSTDKSMRALLGEERWKKVREGRDRDRQAAQAQAEGQPPGAPAPRQ